MKGKREGERGKEDEREGRRKKEMKDERRKERSEGPIMTMIIGKCKKGKEKWQHITSNYVISYDNI